MSDYSIRSVSSNWGAFQGSVTLNSSPGFQPFGYGGGLYDDDTNLLRFGIRDYAADLGRWTSRDPASFVGASANLYEYAESDPINKYDPTGLEPTDPDKCAMLRKRVEAQQQEVQQRIKDMKDDIHGLYKRRTPHPEGWTWAGHGAKLAYEQGLLRLYLAELDANRCGPPPPGAQEVAIAPIPERPDRFNSQNSSMSRAPLMTPGVQRSWAAAAWAGMASAAAWVFWAVVVAVAG